jgi:hypothetical protein
VSIDSSTPLGELCVTHDPPRAEARGDFRVAIRDAFGAAQRQLATQHGHVKERHVEKPEVEADPEHIA